MWTDPGTRLQLRNVPGEWFEDPEALGYVTVAVLTEGKTSLKTPVARHFLQVGVPEPGSFHGPPGIGLAWLHLARQGLDPPVSPASLIHLALHMPTDFFHAVGEEDLLPLGRLILEGRGAIEAWDVHTLLAAVDRARISVHAPFRLFNELMAADWMTREVKREILPRSARVFTRGPEAQGARQGPHRLSRRRSQTLARISYDLSGDHLHSPAGASPGAEAARGARPRGAHRRAARRGTCRVLPEA